MEKSRPIGDEVQKPAHYNAGKHEVIDVIEDWKLGFHLGNTVKYIGRAGHKDPAKLVQDLEKAQWYLRRKIEQLKSDQSQQSMGFEIDMEKYEETFGKNRD